MAQLRITDAADSEKATLPVSDYSIKREGFNVIPEADVAVARELLNEVSGLTPGEDRAYIEEGGTDTFGGILRSPDRQGGVSVLKIRGKAQYFVRAPSVPTGQQKVNADDSTLVKEAIDQTPQLTAGTINTVEAGQTWVFGGISQWEKAKKVANAAGGEIEVESDGTVNYTAQRGSDKTTTTLSPGNQSFVEDTFVLSRDGVSGRTSHLLVTGVGQGTGQVEVAIVPADDTTTYSQYDRVATYTNSSWSDGDPAIWGTPRGNKELKNGDLAESYGKKLINELQSEEVRIDTTVKGNTVNLGDTFHISNSKEGVDENLRAVEVVELLSASGGKRYETVFSNYEFAHQDASREDHKDARRYGSGAFEGAINRINHGPGRGPVGPNHDYVMSVEYPDDVINSIAEELEIKGLNYRAYSAGAASGGTDSDTTLSNFPDSDNATMDFLRSSMTGSLLQVDVPAVGGNGVIVLAYASVQNTSGGTYDAQLDIDNINSGTTLYNGVDETYNDGEMRFFEAVETGSNLEGDTIEFNLSKSSSSESLTSAGVMVIGDHFHQFDWAHVHEPDPGILDWDGTDRSPALYPENVDVVINGTSQGYALGDGTGEFEETVDIEGELSQGWNEIRLTSDSLGHIDSTFSGDMFRQNL